MNDIFKEVFSDANTAKQTPIEIALGIDVEGKTTATKLYDFLELDSSNYSKWFRKNIIENKFAEEKIDYSPFVLGYESLTGKKERQDAKLTANLAKKLSMMQRNEKGEVARNYFVGIENGAKKLMEYKANKMEEGKLPFPLNSMIASSVAELGRVTERIMKNQGSAPYKIAEIFKIQCEQFGIRLPDDFVKVPEYEQMNLQI